MIQYKNDNLSEEFCEWREINKPVTFTNDACDSIKNTTKIVENDDDFIGKVFILTGKLNSFSEYIFMKTVCERGGIVRDYPPTQRDADRTVVVNAFPSYLNPTGKLKRAEELQRKGYKIKIIDESTFLKMLESPNAIDGELSNER